MVRSFACACPPPSGSLCSQRRTLSAVLPLSDLGSLLEIGQENLSTNSGPQKTSRFFYGLGNAASWCRKPQNGARQICGDSKGPSLWRIFLHTFCASRKYGPRRASSQSPLCLGLPSVALGPLPCSSFPQQTHFVGLCRGPHFPLGSGKNAVGDTSPLTLRGNPLQ